MHYVAAIGYLLVAIVEFPALFKKKDLRMIISVITIYVAGLVMSVLFIMGVKIPSPMIMAGNFIKNVLHLSY